MAKPIRSSAALAHWQKPIRSDITGSGITIQSPFALTTGHRPWHNSKSPSALTTGHRLWHNGKKTIRSSAALAHWQKAHPLLSGSGTLAKAHPL